MPKGNPGVPKPESQKRAMSNSHRARYAEIRERLNLAPGERISGSRPRSDSGLARIWTPGPDEETESEDEAEGKDRTAKDKS